MEAVKTRKTSSHNEMLKVKIGKGTSDTKIVDKLLRESKTAGRRVYAMLGDVEFIVHPRDLKQDVLRRIAELDLENTSS